MGTPPTRVGIVADDLTGAGDTAVQFVRAGWETELQLQPGPTSADVVAVTTDSRALSAAHAASAVAAAVGQLRGLGITHLYKKIDSTLRGQIRAELRAAMESWSADAIAVVCPAFPEMGRTIVDGRLYVNGVPASETDAGFDPVTPVTESRLPILLGGSQLAHDAAESSEALAARIAVNGPIVVMDAAGDDDLQKLAAAVAIIGSRAIAVGSAGLARHLATAWKRGPQTTERAGKTYTKRDRPAGPVIVIVTSLQEVARRQALAITDAGAARYEPSPAVLLDDKEWERWSAQMIEGFEKIDSTLLLTAPTDRSRKLPPALIPQRFGELTSRIICKHRAGHGVAGVVVTGGDGARAVVDALQATAIRLREEVTAGVPAGTLIGGPSAGLPIVTKAGGFGHASTLLEAVGAVRNGTFA